ncbi:TPA: MarR family transcriptional regulator [Escherichia coli]|nr:MarR family transcriptional regulator [Escherichia coli]
MKNTSDLFNEIIPLGRLIHMVNQKKDRLLNEYLSPLDITAAQFKVLCSIRCAACITPVELKKVLSVDLGALTRMLDRLVCKGWVEMLSVDLGALTRMLDRLVCKGWVERLPNPNDKRGVLVKLTTSGAAICEQCHQLVGQDLHQELTKNLTADEVATLEHLLKKVLP